MLTMNIFYFSKDVKQCAIDHCDKHVVKMIVEYAQLLSTAHHCLGSGSDCIYKMTHKNHPSAVWVRQSSANYQWLYNLFEACLEEYTYRYGKVHATSRLSSYLKQLPRQIIPGSMTTVALAMPDEFKRSDPVEAYQTYFREAKKHLNSWKKRETPKWL